MTQLLSELAPEFGAGRVFRPYRDVRFSADKAPYKTAIAASLELGGYIQLSSQGLGLGSGMYMMAPDQLDRYRQAVASDKTGQSLIELLEVMRAAGIETGGHDSLKTAPRGYAKDHPRIDLLRHKGLVSWKQWPPGAWLGKPAAKVRVVEFFRASGPLRGWLEVNVWASTLEQQSRY
jgi:uncharacterized protein (TIGR02453 family)